MGLRQQRASSSTAEFKGDIKVNNNPPTKADLERAADLVVLDKDKKKHTFKSLYADNEHGPRRVLVVFIRHFFCGNCQEYLRTLTASLTPSTLSSLPTPTEVVIIGSGTPDLIPMYTTETGCPFPIYTDPTRKLYDTLHMTKTLQLGNKHPEYMQRSMLSVILQSIVQEFRSGRRMLQGGDFFQVGGEFVFEGGRVSWCHRMRNTRDHAELLDVRKNLGLDGAKVPPRQRWSTGMGQGLGRRLSNRRQSWQESRRVKRQSTIMAEATAMEKLREVDGEDLSLEEEGEGEGEGGGMEDAYAKLVGAEPAVHDGGVADGAAESKVGHANESVRDVLKETDWVANRPVQEPVVAGDKGMSNGHANGHVAEVTV